MAYPLKQHVFSWKSGFEMRCTLPVFLKERTPPKNLNRTEALIHRTGLVVFPFVKMHIYEHAKTRTRNGGVVLSLYCSTRYKSSARDTSKFSVPKACMIRKLNVMMYDRGGGVLVVQILLL